MKKNIVTYPQRENSLVITSQRVVEKMENNPAFPNPPAALATLKNELPEFRSAMVKAKSRDKEMVSVKNDKKIVILTLLAELAEYVTVTCKDDKTLILSSGFDVADEQDGNPAPSIEKLEIDLGESGVATTRIKNITGAKAYMHQYTTEPPGQHTVWVSEGSSQRYYTFTGLTSDKRHWFRVVAIGNGGQRAFSPVVSRAIQ